MDSSAFDDSAFPFFCIGCLTFYLVPSWYSILHRVIEAFPVDEKAIGATCRTKVEQRKAAALKKENSAANVLSSRAFLVHLAVTLAFTILLVWLLWIASEESAHHMNVAFDPFAILGVDRSASRATIKKARNELGKRYHEDKCRGDAEACKAAKDMMVTINRAYETLLKDKVARKNWEEWGDPEGQQATVIRYGLPSILLDWKYGNLVLIAYLVIIVGLIPYLTWRYYCNSSKYGEKNVMYNTYSWFHQTLDEKMDLRSLPEVLAGSAEFRGRNCPKTAPENQAVARILQAVRQQMVKPRFNNAICIKGNALLHAHVLRKTGAIMDPASGGQNGMLEHERDDLNFMLHESYRLIDAMVSVCHHQNALSTMLNCISLGQYIAQACWVKDSNLIQLPHFTQKHVQRCRKVEKVQNIRQYRSLPGVQKDNALADLTADQKKDISEFLRIFPDIAVSARIFVDDDEDNRVYENDLVTLQVTITRQNLAAGEQAGLVHAPYFPGPLQEAFWVVLSQAQKVLSVEKVTNPNRSVIHNIKFMAPPTGTYDFDLFVKSNGYVGADHHQKVQLTSLDRSTLPEYQVHPDDAELDNEPTLFEEMMRLNVEEDDSDDEDSDDEEVQGREDHVDVRDHVAAKRKEQLCASRKGADE